MAIQAIIPVRFSTRPLARLQSTPVLLESSIRVDGQPARPVRDKWYGEENKGFGYGTVHHAAGSLRMPWRPRYDQGFAASSVLNEDLRVVGTDRLYVCDMSVMPISTAANPVRTLVALALRLSRHLG
jgi:choline dehydrogenase-like flavoprotein